jgi:HNH endonuclease
MLFSIDRFWSKVDRSGGAVTCWPWTGWKRGGYGRLRVEGRKQVSAHRFVWETVHGTIPDGLGVLHRCDNPCCCNPKHLFLGTPLDNARDRDAKGRGGWWKNSGDSSFSRRHPERLARGDRNGSRTHPERLARGDLSGHRKFPWLYRGENNGRAKITWALVNQIRSLFAAGVRQKEIVQRFGLKKGVGK